MNFYVDVAEPEKVSTVTDALFYILRASQLGPLVRGISLPNQKIFLNAQFINDTSLFIELDEDNFDNMCQRLQFFYLVSRAKVAPHKSSIIGWSLSSPN